MNRDLVVERLDRSIGQAKEGDREKLSAFKMLDVNIREEERSAEKLLPVLLERGERLEQREADHVARTLLGDLEELR